MGVLHIFFSPQIFLPQRRKGAKEFLVLCVSFLTQRGEGAKPVLLLCGKLFSNNFCVLAVKCIQKKTWRLCAFAVNCIQTIFAPWLLNVFKKTLASLCLCGKLYSNNLCVLASKCIQKSLVVLAPFRLNVLK